MTLPDSSPVLSLSNEFVLSTAKGGRMELLSEDTSAISESPPGAKPNSWSRDCRLGESTLSSLAFPSFESGSSCSLSMLKRVDKPGMIKLVRKSSTLGSADPRSKSGVTSSCWPFFPFFVFFATGVSSPVALSFFLLRKPIIMTYYVLAMSIEIQESRI
jgi:hypothetical protein